MMLEAYGLHDIGDVALGAQKKSHTLEAWNITVISHYVTNLKRVFQFLKKILLNQLTLYNFSSSLGLTNEIFYSQSFFF